MDRVDEPPDDPAESLLLANCARCGIWAAKNSQDHRMEPCPICGSVQFWCMPLFDPRYPHPGRFRLIDVSTGEVLPDSGEPPTQSAFDKIAEVLARVLR